LLAGQSPWWEPGTRSGYHAISFGYLVGEVVRRITGKSLGTFFQEEVAAPLQADFHIGLPAKFDPCVADLITYPAPIHGDANYVDPELVKDKFPIYVKTFLNSPVIPEKEVNSRSWRAAEIPASNGHGNARSVARIASVLACGGEVNGKRLLSLATIEKSIEEQCYKTDLTLMEPIKWGLGWGINCPERHISPNPRSFYWSGAGGSVVIMDLDARLSYAYVMNKMEPGVAVKARSLKLSEALYASL
jgi:CubicO group peptidase (beta-lactamase class C family)